MDQLTTMEELLEMVFSMQFVLRLYKNDSFGLQFS
jgi:hypothetical protein